MAKPPAISVIIPTYNEATYVGRLLGALGGQNFKDFDVVVSDASPDDKTAEIIEKYKKQFPLKLVRTPPEGPAAGRNRGAAEARGRWLLFLDADVDIDDPDFLGTLHSETTAHSWQTATTPYRFRDASLLERLGGGFNLAYIRLLAHTRHPVAPGFCIFTRRELFSANGGFDEKLYFGEDYDYVTRAAQSGFGFVTGTYYYQDLRRFRQGHQFGVFIKNVLAEIYRHTHGHKIDKPPFRYEFGKHQKRGD